MLLVCQIFFQLIIIGGIKKHAKVMSLKVISLFFKNCLDRYFFKSMLHLSKIKEVLQSLLFNMKFQKNR